MEVKQRSAPGIPESMTSSVANVDPIELDDQSTLVIVAFSDDCSEETKEWLRKKFIEPVPEGAGLRVKPVLDQDSKKTFHLSASEKRLVQGAEGLRIKKRDKNNKLREITQENWQEFEENCENSNVRVLNSADKQRIILDALNDLRAPEEMDVPGCVDKKLYIGQAILPLIQAYGLVTQIVPLNNRDELNSLKQKWYKTFEWRQPLDAIKDYYGSTIAIYFAFLEYYTFALVPLVLLVFTFSIINLDELWYNLIFALINVLWGTVFLEFWKRNCATMTHRWGTLKQSLAEEQEEDPRPLYTGETRISPVTGKKEIHYPEHQRYLKICCVSVPIVLFCIFIAISVMSGYIRIQDSLNGRYEKETGFMATFMTTMPSVLYTIVILVLNNLYLRTATKLNDWENHKLESSYQNHLVVKLISFFFINNFYSLFHIAFVLQDMDLLRSHLAALMITSQLTGQVTEQLLPYVLYKTRSTKINTESKTLGLFGKAENDIEYQMKQEPYWGVFWDYLELFLQFGYVFLFSSVYPMAAFWALFNNVFELRTDAFKICKISQRVFAQPSQGIGAWQTAFEVMGILAVMTNCALLAMSPSIQQWLPSDFSTLNTIFVFVAIEHILLGIKLVIAVLIPDVPGWIQEEFAREEYKRKEVLAKKRLQSIS
ncbi:anoctamin-10-like [Dendronephthya gigantea]|uniref:anoctamin-10-like n=1 Tax=Dendronephthya gigantea TaxID=151771 RepID=UPI001069F811|nr:anoctamin-10-like [Dendronephthya gigantea]XP_028392876.1 anoctamin-10-like [Dendronephthya gigantea]